MPGTHRERVELPAPEKLAALGHLAAAATLGARGIGWRFADQFGGHEAGHEKFAAMVVEFNERALRIRFRDHAESILVMLDLLPLGKCLHDLPPYFQAGLRVQPGHQPLAAQGYDRDVRSGPGREPDLGLGLETYDGFGLQAFGALADLKLDRLALIQ